MSNNSDNLIAWALNTGRIHATSESRWRARLNNGETTEADVRSLYPIPPEILSSVDDNNSSHFAASGGFSIPVAGSRSTYRRDDDGLIYAANPAIDELAIGNSGAYSSAVEDDPEIPKLFGKRDLPLATLSGLPVDVLTELPAVARHAVANEPNPAKAAEMANKYADVPELAAFDLAGDPGWLDYLNRVKRWAIGYDTREKKLTKEESDADYEAVWPKGEKVHYVGK